MYGIIVCVDGYGEFGHHVFGIISKQEIRTKPDIPVGKIQIVSTVIYVEVHSVFTMKEKR